ncbi:uncharacterized protein [Mycetomoellerius zeteki]|uniref:uncharacterized protein isoform X3 n=1 Tax=Mycetomoellerius zeteki TaxID=64791 RepID=UPI00084E93C3|nr:PREDICTED: uncharacterized protein LOC108726395 isoform X3 [Trachymyrmex zeteki]
MFRLVSSQQIQIRNLGKNDIMSNSQSAIFKVRQHMNDVDMLEYPAPNVIRSNGLWINMDRPEKSILYSAWLQRFEGTRRVNARLGN